MRLSIAELLWLGRVTVLAVDLLVLWRRTEDILVSGMTVDLPYV